MVMREEPEDYSHFSKQEHGGESIENKPFEGANWCQFKGVYSHFYSHFGIFKNSIVVNNIDFIDSN